MQSGSLDIVLEDGTTKRIGITRAHLEEDAGKSLHEDFHGLAGIDLNRAGTPLLEIVSEPDMRSAREAVAYMKKIHTLVRYLEICDGNMQEGSFRCDANVSVRPKGEAKFGTPCRDQEPELLPLRRARIDYEIERQVELIEDGGKVVQETRLYDPDADETRSMRSQGRGERLPLLPRPRPAAARDRRGAASRRCVRRCRSCRTQKAARFVADHGLSAYDAGVLTASRELADYYETVVKGLGGQRKLAANWVMGELSGALNRDGLEITQSRVSAAALAQLLARIVDNTISGKIAKEVFEAMWAEGKGADEIIDARGLRQITDTSAIEKAIDEVMAKNPQQLAEYRSGKDKLFGFFVGQVMKATQGKANPAQLNELLKRKLSG